MKPNTTKISKSFTCLLKDETKGFCTVGVGVRSCFVSTQLILFCNFSEDFIILFFLTTTTTKIMSKMKRGNEIL